MKTPHVILSAAVLLAVSVAGLAQTASQAAGHWEGTIHMPNRDVGAVVDLARNAQGVWTGSMTVTGSTSVDVPLADITAEGTTVRFTARLAGNPSFEGKLSAEGGTIDGVATNAQGEAAFELTRNGEANVKLPAPSSRLTKEFAGAWEGALEVGDKKLRLALTFSAVADGTARASLVTLDQGNQDVPVATVTLTEKSVQLAVLAISGSYRGTLVSTGEIAGEWTQGGIALPLSFRRSTPPAKTSKLWKASHPRTEALPSAWPTVLIRSFAPFAPYLDFAVVARHG